jgi:Xaa-Pro aminopeptidase
MTSYREIQARREKLAHWLEENDFQAAIFLKEDLEDLHGDFIYYGGSIDSEYAAIVIGANCASYAIAHEYAFDRVKASSKYDSVEKIRQSTNELVVSLRRLLMERFPRKGKIAFDFSCLKVNTWKLLKECSIRVADNQLTSFVHSERSVKSPYEIREMKAGIEIAKRAFETTIGSLKEGQSASEISKNLNRNMLEEGAVGPSFDTTVHITREERAGNVDRTKRGDVLFFDFGARLVSGYCSDVGRTIPLGRISTRSNDFLNDVFSIKKEGLKKIKSGISGNEIRHSIDKLIEEFGYVSTHRPGHQIGINVHEPYGPNLAYGKENSMKLRNRNVVTWEPGIGFGNSENSKPNYDDYGMAHVEDMVLVGERSRILGGFEQDYR